MKLHVKNFGPLTIGTNGFIDISNYTVFIGTQGSGKSTLAKLISVFAWLEKCLIRGDLSIKEVERKNRFRDKFCKFNRLSSFFTSATEICCIGSYYQFHYKEDSFKVCKLNEDNTQATLSKIMYVPAERNIISISDKSGITKYYPESLSVFWEAYEDFCQNMREDLVLPIDNMKFSYDKLNHIAWIKDLDQSYRTRLTDAASGYQSLIPLYVVSKSLYDLVGKKNESDIDSDLYRKLKSEVMRIMNNKELSEDVKSLALKQLSSRFSYSHVVNIVEEPELNLYPSSQCAEIEALVRMNNINKDNKLILTTHSPYVLATLNNLLYAGKIGELKETQVQRVLPKALWIQPNTLQAYELKDGMVVDIIDDELGLIKSERIDIISSEINDKFDAIMDIEIEEV